MTGETYYVKRGRRYVPAGNVMPDFDYADRMRVNQWRMTYCHAHGEYRYEYAVTPDTASFVAACMLARAAMERAIEDAAIARPQFGVTPYTKRQLALIERFRQDMAATGGLTPTHWQHSSSRDVSEAAIKAVREWVA